MAPELLNKLDADECTALAVRVRDYQTSRSLTFAALQKKLPGIGSDRTFNRILNGDFSQLDLEQQLANYRAVVALIESLGDTKEVTEPLYDDLTPVVALRKALIEAMREGGNARLVLLEGDTGMGKTSARKVLLEKFGQRLLWIESTVAWNDSPMAMLGSVLLAMGVKNPPLNIMWRLNEVTERLNAQRIALIIEEAHHLGPKCLNLCKTLINATPGEFVLLALPTLWRRLERDAYEEVRQLTGNRLAERIKLPGLRESDVKKFLTRRIPGMADPTPVLEAMGTQLVSLTKRAFNDSALRAAPWPPRKNQATRNSSGQFLSQQLLKKTGALYQSIAIARLTSKEVHVGTDRPYAAAHQFGSSKRNLPARPFFPFLSGRMIPSAQEKIEATAKRKIAALLPK